MTREDDERLLDWLRLRCVNLSSGMIADRYGVKPEAVRLATTHVLNADVAESGEPERTVRARYWARA